LDQKRHSFSYIFPGQFFNLRGIKAVDRHLPKEPFV
jgi:hypothetical protein